MVYIPFLPPLQLFFNGCSIQISCCGHGDQEADLVTLNEGSSNTSCWSQLFLSTQKRKELNKQIREGLEREIQQRHNLELATIAAEVLIDSGDRELIRNWRERMREGTTLRRGEQETMLAFARRLANSSPGKTPTDSPIGFSATPLEGRVIPVVDKGEQGKRSVPVKIDIV